MDTNAFQDCLDAISAIDVAAYREQLDALHNEHARVRIAIVDNENLIYQGDRARSDRLRGPNAEVAANAVLAGADVLEAVDTVAAIDQRREAHIAARKGLRYREADLRSEIESVVRQVKAETKSATESTADGMRRRLADIMAELAALEADALAIAQASGTRQPDVPHLVETARFARSRGLLPAVTEPSQEVMIIVERLSPLAELTNRRLSASGTKRFLRRSVVPTPTPPSIGSI